MYVKVLTSSGCGTTSASYFGQTCRTGSISGGLEDRSQTEPSEADEYEASALSTQTIAVKYEGKKNASCTVKQNGGRPSGTDVGHFQPGVPGKVGGSKKHDLKYRLIRSREEIEGQKVRIMYIDHNNNDFVPCYFGDDGTSSVPNRYQGELKFSKSMEADSELHACKHA